MADKFKLTSREHPDYTENKIDWAFYMKSFKGGSQYPSGNLFSHRLENSEDYSNRLRRAYYLNFCKPLPNIYTDYIYKNRIKRPQVFSKEFTDIDKRGRSINDFARLCSVLSGIYGHVHVLVDKSVDAEGISKADAKSPYAVIYKPENVVDWAFDENGNLLWVLLYEPTYVDTDPMSARVTEKRFRLLTQAGWEVWRADGDKETKLSFGVWPFATKGKIPFKTCFNADADNDMIGESMLRDIAPINRIIFNWCSLIDEQFERQTFSQLVTPDTGTGEGTGGSDAKKIATATAFTFPADSKFPPMYIGPNTDNSRVIWEVIEKHITEIYRHAMLDKGDTSIIHAQSGVAKAYEFVDTNQALVTKAQYMERFEGELYDAFGLWTNQKIDAPVEYAKEFDIISVEREIKNAFDIVAEGISDTLKKALYKRVARKALPSADDKTFKTIDAEIDALPAAEKTDLEVSEDDGTKEPMPDENQDEKPVVDEAANKA
ncbi:MAG: hypothetical protein WC483_05675 [Candidatus Paceibacterota bacterium]